LVERRDQSRRCGDHRRRRKYRSEAHHYRARRNRKVIFGVSVGTILKLAVYGLQVVKKLIAWAERRAYMNEGERRRFQKEIEGLNASIARTEAIDVQAAGDSDAALDSDLQRPVGS
jgi:hypothetical protein